MPTKTQQFPSGRGIPDFDLSQMVRVHDPTGNQTVECEGEKQRHCCPTSGGKASTVGAKRDAPDFIMVPIERVENAAGPSVPNLPCPVHARRGDEPTIRAESNIANLITMAFERRKTAIT